MYIQILLLTNSYNLPIKFFSQIDNTILTMYKKIYNTFFDSINSMSTHAHLLQAIATIVALILQLVLIII